MVEKVWMRRLLDGTPRAWALGHLYFQKQRFAENPSEFIDTHEPSEWLLGYAIPPFQRELVWDEDRMIRFVESAVLGLHIGTWVYNNAMDAPIRRTKNGDIYHQTDLWLIDGQQRLNALDRFWDDRFPVFGYYWSQVPIREQRHFLNNTHFAAFETHIYDVNALKELYDRLNFGGVAHTLDQKAVQDGEDLILPTSDRDVETPEGGFGRFRK